MFIAKIANRVHRGESGFTLIEMLVVMAILAILVGLVVPHFFGIIEDADVAYIMAQHHQMRTAVFLYHRDTGRWPTEWSGAPVDEVARRQLWHAANVSGWRGPYIDRPILQRNRWGGHWGVEANVLIPDVGVPVIPVPRYTVFRHYRVPRVVAEAVDRRIDNGDPDTGAVQLFPLVGDPVILTIVIARE
jgi:general secretion pathway protein G